MSPESLQGARPRCRVCGVAHHTIRERRVVHVTGGICCVCSGDWRAEEHELVEQVYLDRRERKP